MKWRLMLCGVVVLFGVASWTLRASAPSTSAIAVFHGVGERAVSSKGIKLEELTWYEAEKALTSDTIVVIPVGVVLKEHGPHMPLNTDWIITEYLRQAVYERANVVVIPTINYSYVPAFSEYPGSVSVSVQPSFYTIVDICTSLAAFGPKRFYGLGLSITPTVPLRLAARELANAGILLTYTDPTIPTPGLDDLENDCGFHADRYETSRMLWIAPRLVQMERAIRDCEPERDGGISRQADGRARYSPTGILGDPTLADARTGKRVLDAVLASILEDIEGLRRAELRHVVVAVP